MKILYCVLENRPCGANLRGYRMARSLRVHGVETVFLVNEKQRGAWPYEEFQCLVLKFLQIFRKEKGFRNALAFGFCFPWNLWMICRWIRKYQIDVVQVVGMMNVLPALAARITGRRILWLLNDMSVPRAMIWILRPFVRRWSWRIGLSVSALADHYFGEDPVVRRKIVILHAPVETETWRPEAVDSDSVERFRQQFDLNGKRPIIASVGNVNPAKGYEFFVEMANLLRRRYPSAVFVVAGARLDSQRKYTEEIDQRIHQWGLTDAFRFLGYWQDVRVVLAACDVFVMSSVQEAGPTVVLEAMSMGRPIVATDVGGVREQIDDDLSGIVVPSRSGERLAEGVRRVLAMAPEQRLRMTAAARNHVERVYDIHQVINEYLGLFGNPSSQPRCG